MKKNLKQQIIEVLKYFKERGGLEPCIVAKLDGLIDKLESSLGKQERISNKGMLKMFGILCKNIPQIATLIINLFKQ